jgi:hypothetical protein
MRRKSIIAALVFVVILQLAGVILVRTNQAGNPNIQGQPLQTWVDQCQLWRWPPDFEAGYVFRQNREKTERLLRPMLSRREEGGLRQKLRQWLVRKNLLRDPGRPPGDYHARALDVCNWLGPEAPGAVPGVLGLLNDFPSRVKDPVIAKYALFVLADLGTNGADALTSVLTNKNPAFRLEAARLLGTSRVSQRPLVLAALEHASREGSVDLRRTAQLSLRLVQERQDQFRTVTPETPQNSPALTNLWTFRRGLVVTSTSGLHPGSAGVDLFGGRVGTSEPGHLVFKGDQPDGYVHYIEWITPSSVSLQSFAFLGFHDSANNSFLHAIREFRLLVWDEASERFVLIDRELNFVPYGLGFYSCCLCSFRNLPQAVTGSRFRLEVVQCGPGTAGGPRLLGLYGFDHPATKRSARAAICDQEPPFVYTVDPEVLDLPKAALARP